MSDAPAALLAVANISKRFGSFAALTDVSLSVAAGEVHGLLGANGAGKSTLIRILSGAIAPDSGTLQIAGQLIPSGSLKASRQAGLVVVHQELMLFGDRSVEENIFASVLPSAPLVPVWPRERRQRVLAVLDRLAAHVDINERVGRLPLPHRQIVEIGRAICAGGRVLVLDEPTSSLSRQEASRLFDVIRSIVANEAAVIFVSHRLDEVFALTSTITVLRDGRLAGTWPTRETDASEITRAMVGPLADERSPQASGGKATSVAIALNGASRAMPAGIELKLHAGEIIGLAGLEGSGVSDVLEMLGGVAPVKGSIEVAGKAVRFRHPLDALRAGVAYMPPDRKKDGLWLQRDNAFNIGVAALSRKAPFSRINRTVLDKVAIPRLVQVGVRESALHEAAGNLSGGNQQRVLLGRALEAQPQVLLLSDFTRGVDVSAKAAIHQIIRSLAAEGIAICATSSDLEELLGVADRIVCLRSGKIVADAPSASFDKLSLLALASGA